MYLKEIKISGFRLFNNLHLELNRGLNILVGENDSGKTALIDAIRYTLGTNSSDRSFISESDFHKDCATFTIQLKFDNVERHAYRFVEHLTHEEYMDDAGEPKRKSVLFLQLKAQQTGSERRGYPYIKTELRSGMDGNGLALEPEIRDFLASTYLKPLRDAAAELSSGRASRLSQILSSSKTVRDDVNSILGIIAKANADLLHDDRGLKASAKNIEQHYLHKLIFEQDKTRLGANIDIAGIKTGDLEDLDDVEKRRQLRTVLEGLSLSLTKERLLHGLGYHNLLFMAAELLLLAQESGKELPLLLIEEPEAHLHPQLQMKLLQFIQEKVKSEKEPDGIQCILSTHSPNLSSKADPASIIMLGGGRACALRPGETELAADDYTFLRKFLDATKANVFFARAILFVEGDGENILLPQLARFLGRPFEDYGVSVVKCDNSGSWKRFVRLFLRSGKDDEPESWPLTRVCVLRDLDLWPPCAEEKGDGSNPYGHREKKMPTGGRGGNLGYWEKLDTTERDAQIAEKMIELKGGGETLERQGIKVLISNRWTFEFCLARYGLFEACYKAVKGSTDGIDEISGPEDQQATYIQMKVSKTDFAYVFADILAAEQSQMIAEAIEDLGEPQRQSRECREAVTEAACRAYALSLKDKLPPYIVEAIEHVTAPIGETTLEEAANAGPA